MNYISQMRLRNKLLLGFAIPAMLTITLSALSYNSVNRLVNAFDWVEHTHTAIGYGDKLLGSMIDMETGLRGFLVAGDVVFLEPYDGGKVVFYETLSKVREHVSDNAAQLARLDEILSLKENWLSDHAEPVILLRKKVNESNANQGSNVNSATFSDVTQFIGRGLGKKSMDKLREIVADFVNEEQKLIKARTVESKNIAGLTKAIVIAGALIAALGSVIIVLLITRNVSRQLGTEPAMVEKIAKNIADGNLSQDLSTDRPATGVFAAMQIMQHNLQERLEHDQHSSADMARIKQALDSASASVIVTDTDLTVIYQNREAAIFFNTLESRLQTVLSSFSANNLIGSNIDQLLLRGGISRADLERQTSSLKQSSIFGSVTLGQIFSPILCENGNRIGTIIEWQDRTDQLAVEDEIKSVVDAALEGDLSKRLELEGKEGFFLLLGERMNDLVSVCEDIVGDTMRIFNAMSQYDLTESIAEDYKGSFAQLKKNANLTMVQLTGIIGDVRSDAAMLDSATFKLNKLNEQMYDTAETSSDQASNVSSAAAQISNNISGVASASTQMNASISEISRNAADATKIAGDAVSLAESTKTTVRKLSDSSNDIGNVIKVINSIAEQTNLLALNATIEAARAGDAGKGFAVVANEVKELAKETAKATDEIGQKIATIQTDSDSAVEAINGIDQTIQKINDIQVMIASAVQEQKATTNEISRSVNEAAAGSTHIAANSSEAATGAMKALSNTSEAQQSTSELSKLASELSARVKQFKIKAA